jgi:two-component system, NarL family, sensor kinase
MFFALIVTLAFVQENAVQDSLLTNITSRPDSVQALNYIAVAKKYFSSPQIADSLAQLAFASARRAGKLNEQGEGAFIICFANLNTDFAKSRRWADTAVYYFEKAENYKWAGYVTRNMGLQANIVNKYDLGLQYLQRSTRSFEKVQDTLMVVHNLASFSLAYHNYLSDYKTGLRYGLDAQKLLEKLRSPRGNIVWLVNNAIAINYDDDGQYAKALDYHFRNINHASDKEDLASTYNNIGNTFKKQGEFRKAHGYFRKSLATTPSDDDDNDYHLATVYNNLSHISWELMKPSMAKHYRDSAIYFSHKSKRIDKLLDTYYDSYEMCAKNNDFENATVFLKAYTTIKDSVLNAEKTKIIYDLEKQYESEKKEQTIALLQSQATVKDLQIQRSRNLMVYLSIAVLLSASLVYLLYKRSRYRQKLAFARETEELQRQRFRAVMEAEENERARVAKDLHDGIGQLLSVAKLTLSAIEIPQDAEPLRLLNNSMQVIDQAAKEVRSISHNMMPAALTEIGLDAALRDLFLKINESKLLRVNLEAKGLDDRLPASVEIAVYRVVQEVINNMMKHSKADTISVYLTRTGPSVRLSIADNGVGFEKELIAKSRGLGWKNILSRISMLNGQIEVDTQPGAGTNVNIQFAI